MPKIFLSFAALIFSGCSWGVPCEITTPLRAEWSIVSTEYVGYVESDDLLSEEKKDLRILRVQILNELLKNISEEDCGTQSSSD